MLVKYAIAINKKTGINQVVIGATFVAVATTLPEVFVSIFAVSAGNHEIAIGNALGAMAANIGLVLGVTFLFTGGTVSRRDVLWKAIFMLVTIAVVFLFSLNRMISLLEGTILLLGFVAFLWFNIKESKKYDRPNLPLCNQVKQPTEDCVISWRRIMLGFVVAQTMLAMGAFTLVKYGEQLAHIMGVSETLVGFTVIALGTSTPELLTAIASIRRKSGGLALGNVIGANVINATLLFGVCGIIGDLQGTGLPLTASTVFVAVPALLIMTLIATLPVLIKGRAHRWQGACLILSYFVFVGFLVFA